MHTIPGDLPALRRERAETLRTYGDPTSARPWDIAAAELERATDLVRSGDSLSPSPKLLANPASLPVITAPL